MRLTDDEPAGKRLTLTFTFRLTFSGCVEVNADGGW